MAGGGSIGRNGKAVLSNQSLRLSDEGRKIVVGLIPTGLRPTVGVLLLNASGWVASARLSSTVTSAKVPALVGVVAAQAASDFWFCGCFLTLILPVCPADWPQDWDYSVA